jgi:regulator of sigma E protease
MTAFVFAACAGVGLLGGVAIVIVSLGLIFLVHELGHLLAAKVCRVKVSRYYLGFHGAADPQSFAAKAVWQRMVIVAAGGLMNLLLAVTLATIAYRMGVSYTPCILGGTAPGDPAWVLGLEPGDKILQIGRSGRPKEHLRFDKDLTAAVVLHGTATELDMLIRRSGQQQAEWVRIRPSDRLQSTGRPATLGVFSASTTRLADSWPPPRNRWAAANPQPVQPLLPGDEIVAVNHVPLPRDEQTGEILGHHLQATFVQHMTEPMTLSVLRRTESAGDAGPSLPQPIEVVVPPVPMRMLGLAMEVGPIMAVRAGNPADAAGFRVRDVLLTINGHDVGDPITLAQRLLTMVGQPMEVAVRRADQKQPVALRVVPRVPTTYEDASRLESPLALESLGVALRVENLVQSVDPDGPACQAGLRAGDEIIEVRFQVADPTQRREMRAAYGRFLEQPIELGDDSSQWPYVHASLQAVGAGAQVAVTYRRQETTGTALIVPCESDVWFHADRGMRFEGLRQLRVAESWTEACVAGMGETRENLVQTVAVLRRVVSGKLEASSVGGPVTVIRAGNAEASRGTLRLLLFLALLSVSIAVLCWLPIPGFDGGHLLLLAIEGLRGKPLSRQLQLIFVVVLFACPAAAFRTLPLTCLSQLFHVIGLIRGRGAARPDAASLPSEPRQPTQ